MTISVVTLKDHHYGERRKAGDVYEVPGQSVLQLVKAMGWAKEQNAVAAPAPISTAALTAATATPAAKKTTRAPRKAAGSYLTRDMAAQPGPDVAAPAAAPAEPEAPATPADDAHE